MCTLSTLYMLLLFTIHFFCPRRSGGHSHCLCARAQLLLPQHTHLRRINVVATGLILHIAALRSAQALWSTLANTVKTHILVLTFCVPNILFLLPLLLRFYKIAVLRHLLPRVQGRGPKVRAHGAAEPWCQLLRGRVQQVQASVQISGHHTTAHNSDLSGRSGQGC